MSKQGPSVLKSRRCSRLGESSGSLCLAILVGLLAIVAARGPLRAAEEEPPGPVIEDRPGDNAAYLAQAQAFLAEHARSPDAARVAFEALMVATVDKNHTAADALKDRLLLDYPRSLYTEYLLTTLADAAAYRKFLQRQLEAREDNLTDAYSRQFCVAVHLGLRQPWGASLLEDGQFAMQCAVLAHAAADYRLKTSCLAALEKHDTYRAMAEVALGDMQDETAWIVRLHEDPASSARWLERFFLSQLPEPQRRLPQIMRIEAENHLSKDNFGAALPLLDELLGGGDDPQLLFQRGWCLATLGRTDEAIGAFRAVAEKSPDSPWATSAGKLAPAVEKFDASIREQARAIVRWTAALRVCRPEVFEATLVIRSKEQPDYRVYLGIDERRQRLAFRCDREQETLLAYRFAEGKSELFLIGEPAASRFDGAVVPVPEVRLRREADGKYNLQLGGQITNRITALKAAALQLFESPCLATEDDVLELLRYSVNQKGSFPAAFERTGSATSARWLRPSPTGPELSEFDVQLDPGVGSVAIGVNKGEGGMDVQLRYGDFSLSPPEWPECPIVDTDQVPPSVLFRILGLLADWASK